MEAPSSLLLKKLGVKEGRSAVFLHVPAEVQACCSGLPGGEQPLATDHDLILTFHETIRDLKKELPLLKYAIKPNGMIWVCWRQGSQTDLNRDLIWQLGKECGLHSISSIAVNEFWSAMKLMYPKEMRVGG